MGSRHDGPAKFTTSQRAPKENRSAPGAKQCGMGSGLLRYRLEDAFSELIGDELVSLEKTGAFVDAFNAVRSARLRVTGEALAGELRFPGNQNPVTGRRLERREALRP